MIEDYVNSENMIVSTEEMNHIYGGSYPDCITCTPNGNHTDANDNEDVEFEE